MSSEVQIYNLSLLRVGHSETVAAINESSLAAQLCRVLYAQTRDFVLGDFPWRFAKKRVVLALKAATPPAEWSYAYAMPSDCLRVRSIVTPGNRTPKVEDQVAFETMVDENDEPVIYCDLPQAELIYTMKITDPGRFDAAFVSSLSFAMGAELAIPLRGKPDIAQMMRQAYSQSVSQAAAKSLNEGFEQTPECSFISVRG